MTRALVTGGAGFAGRYLVRHLAAEGVETCATAHQDHEDAPGATWVRRLDVRDGDAVARLVRDVRPDEIYHLAGVTHPASGDVAGFYDVNLGGARNVLEAHRTVVPSSKLLLVGSAYAYAPSPDPMGEDWPIAPRNHYGASKAAAEMLGRAYAAEGAHVVLARPFNHSGPGQPPDFVLPTIVHQVTAATRRGDHHVTLELGNVESVRDISDVRDIVAGYAVALRGGQPGTAYNLGSGAGRTIREIAELVCARAGVELRIERRPERARSDDVSCIVADASRLAGLGWEPRRDLGATIADMLAAPTT